MQNQVCLGKRSAPYDLSREEVKQRKTNNSQRPSNGGLGFIEPNEKEDGLDSEKQVEWEVHNLEQIACLRKERTLSSFK